MIYFLVYTLTSTNCQPFGRLGIEKWCGDVLGSSSFSISCTTLCIWWNADLLSPFDVCVCMCVRECVQKIQTTQHIHKQGIVHTLKVFVHGEHRDARTHTHRMLFKNNVCHDNISNNSRNIPYLCTTRPRKSTHTWLWCKHPSKHSRLATPKVDLPECMRERLLHMHDPWSAKFSFLLFFVKPMVSCKLLWEVPLYYARCVASTEGKCDDFSYVYVSCWSMIVKTGHTERSSNSQVRVHVGILHDPS